MNEECAKKFARQLQEFDIWFNAMSALTMELRKEEGQVIRQSLAKILFELDDGIRLRVKQQFPDIIP